MSIAMNWSSFVRCMTFFVIPLRKRKTCTMVAIKLLGHSRGLEFIPLLEKWIYEKFLISFCLFKSRKRKKVNHNNFQFFRCLNSRLGFYQL